MTIGLKHTSEHDLDSLSLKTWEYVVFEHYLKKMIEWMSILSTETTTVTTTGILRP